MPFHLPLWDSSRASHHGAPISHFALCTANDVLSHAGALCVSGEPDSVRSGLEVHSRRFVRMVSSLIFVSLVLVPLASISLVFHVHLMP